MWVHDLHFARRELKMSLCVVVAPLLFLKSVRKLVGNKVVAFLEGIYVKAIVN